MLWIDAICINQQDLKEKSHQVASMASIFKDAWQVVVWLGSHKETPAQIRGMLERLNEPRRSVQEMSDNLPWAVTKLQSFFDQAWYEQRPFRQYFIRHIPIPALHHYLTDNGRLLKLLSGQV